MGFIGQYVLALIVVGLMLFGLYAVVRTLGRGRLLALADRRLVSVVESTFLSQNTTLHVVKVADKYFLVGGGGGHVSSLAEIPSEQIEPWLREQRELFATQTQSMARFLKSFRRPQ
jgi:flagellar biogenesis protein FliO